jgi:glycosyltransferase involved in cell wall biosynthesis
MTKVSVWFNALHSKAGGGLTYLYNMAPLLAADPRLAVTVIATPDQAVPEGVERLAPPRWVNRLGFLAAEQAWLPLAARRHGVSVVFSPANYGPLWGVPTVILLSNSIAVGRLETRWSKRLYWLAIAAATWASLRRSARALAVSTSIRDELAGRRSGKSVMVVPHGVSPRFVPNLDERDSFILAVGDIYIQKNFHNLIEAFSRVRQSYPNVSLKIAGTVIDQDYKAELDARVSRLGLVGAVEFLGRMTVDGLSALYRRCRVFAFPSLAESFGMPILEAMASGAPVVASDRSAMPEVAGGAGILVDAADPSQLAEAIEAVLGRPQLASEMAEAGVRHAAKFTWEAAAAATADALIAAHAQ